MSSAATAKMSETKMGASSIQCSACNKDVVGSEQAFVCVEVKGRSCTTVAVEMMNESSSDNIWLVHQECLATFERLVASGIYAEPNNN